MKHARLIGGILLAMWLGGCSTAGTWDRLKVGYGPPAVEKREGPNVYEMRNVREVIIDPNGAVRIIAGPKTPMGQGGIPCESCRAPLSR